MQNSVVQGDGVSSREALPQVAGLNRPGPREEAQEKPPTTARKRPGIRSPNSSKARRIPAPEPTSDARAGSEDGGGTIEEDGDKTGMRTGAKGLFRAHRSAPRGM